MYVLNHFLILKVNILREITEVIKLSIRHWFNVERNWSREGNLNNLLKTVFQFSESSHIVLMSCCCV